MSAESVQNSLSMNSPPLPPPPPPPPTSSSNELANSNKRSADGTPIASAYAAPSSMMPSNFAAPPPSMSPAAYQAYYQQYMQYMSYYSYGMYPGATSTAVPTIPPYYNYNQPGVSPGNRAPTLSSPVVTTGPQMKVEPKQAPVQKQQTQSPSIKINIKQPQQMSVLHQSVSMENMETDSLNKTSAKKSRFSSLDSISNVTAQQASYEQETKTKASQLETKPSSVSKQITTVSSSPSAPSMETSKEEQKTTSTTTSQVSDIVYDINKWPIALKTYCAKVYQHYQTITLVSEDQVTKYLQQRITEAFNLKPDLNIGWDKEPLPDIISIRKVAPFSQQQIEQKKRMQEMAANQILAKKNQIQAKQQNQQQKQMTKPALFKPPTSKLLLLK
jgi:hypothetical protein